MTHSSGLSSKTPPTHTPADQATERGWDLYQLDGFWYVNNAMGARRQPTSHRQPPPVQELGAGVSPEEAMTRAKSEAQLREPGRNPTAAKETKTVSASEAWAPTFTTLTPKTPGSTR